MLLTIHMFVDVLIKSFLLLRFTYAINKQSAYADTLKVSAPARFRTYTLRITLPSSKGDLSHCATDDVGTKLYHSYYYREYSYACALSAILKHLILIYFFCL